MTDLTVTHTIAGLFADHGGPSRSVPALCDALSEMLKVSVVTGSPVARLGALNLPMRAETVVVPEPAVWGRLLGLRKFQNALEAHARSSGAVLLHDHGLWMPSNYLAAKVADRLGIPRVVSPRGMLSAWAMRHRSTRKQLAWWLYQRAVLESAAAFHATSDKEADEIRAAGLRQPVAVIPNGVELPDGPGDVARWSGSERVALFMSRLHLKKGAADLVEAWAAVRPVGWKLWIAGPDENGSREGLERQAADAGIAGSVRFLGEIAENDKWRLLQQACLFVLPSYDENYGIVVAEALAAGLPVITTTATPWIELGERGAGWVVEPGGNALVPALRFACGVDSTQLRSMGEKGRVWVTQSLGWDRIALQMFQFYEWILGRRQTRPDCVLP